MFFVFSHQNPKLLIWNLSMEKTEINEGSFCFSLGPSSRRDTNPQPCAYKTHALPNWATRAASAHARDRSKDLQIYSLMLT